MRPFRLWLPGEQPYVVLSRTMKDARRLFIERLSLDSTRASTVEFSGILPNQESGAIEKARQEGRLIE